MGTVKEQTWSGVKWSAVDRFSIQAIQFIIGIVLARLLTPDDYGVIGVLGVFMAVSGTFIDSGFSSALIRKQNRTEEDCSTVFHFNFCISCICYGILFLCAPWIASFFKMPILVKIVRVYCLCLVIGALGSVQFTKLTIAVDFKSIAKINVIVSLLSGAVGIILAYLGCGAWSLVGQSLFGETSKVIMVWIMTKWRPKPVFSKQSFKELFAFGGNLTIASLLHTIYANLSSIIIGKFFSASDLGLYSKGTNLASFPANSIDGVLGRVTYPILAKLQDDDGRLVAVYRKYIKSTSLVIFFLMTLIAALGKPLVLFLYGAKWERAIIYLQVFAFAIMFDHICKLNLNLLYVKGRSDYVLRLEIIKKTISTLILFASIPFGVIGICASKIIYTQIAVFINTWYTGKIYHLGWWTQMKDFMPYLIVSVIACVPAYLLTLTSWHHLVVLIVGGTVSTALYVGYLWLTHNDMFMEFAMPVIGKIKNKLSSTGVLK